MGLYGLFATVLVICCLPGAEGVPENLPPLEFILEDIFEDEKVSSRKHRGRPVLIYFFATW